MAAVPDRRTGSPGAPARGRVDAAAAPDAGGGPGAPATETGFALRLTIPADPAALGVVRAAVGGVAQALGMGAGRVADVRLALTEVCGAALRRLEGPGARLDVACDQRGAGLHVLVRDGSPAGAAAAADLLPLPLVAALTDSVELRRGAGSGTEVAMTFRLGEVA